MIQYFIEVTIAWTLFYSIYSLFLKKETFFNINRWYLLNTLWIGALIPFLRKLPVHFQSAEAIMLEPVAYINYGTHFLSESVTFQTQTSAFNYEFLIGLLYVVGVLICTFKMSLGLLRIWRIYNKGKKQALEDVTLVVSEDFHLPFSFLNKVFIHESFLENDSIKEILDHELTHIKSRHTYDVLFIEIMSILFWWNPIVYLYKKSIRQTHEYVADAYASQHSHKKNYGRILLGQSSSGIELALTNQFFNSHLKKRITMLYKEKSARHKLSRYLLVIPLFLFLSVLFSFDANGPIKVPEYKDGDMQIMLKHNSKVLEVGETYHFEVLNHDETEKLILSLDQLSVAHGLMKNFNVNGHQFSFTPDRPMPKGENITITAKQDKQIATIDLALIGKGSPHASSSKNVSKTEWLYYNYGEIIEKPQGEVTSDGIKMVSSKDDIKAAYGIDVDDNVSVLEFVGNITSIEKVKKDEGQVKLLSGTITSIAGKPLIGATVIVKGTSVGAITDIKGSFSLDRPEGNNTIIVSYVGYISREVNVKNQSVLDISLSPEGSDVHVSEKSFYVDGMNNPMIIINGKISESKDEHYFTESKIISVNVLQSKKAVSKYGDQGKNGAIEFQCNFGNVSTASADGITPPPPPPPPAPEVFKVVEEMPRFPGCEDQGLTKEKRAKCSQHAMLEYLYENLNYPAEAREKNIEGKVYLQFIVRKDGKVTDANIVREIGGGCGDAALEVVNNMPDWIPGKQRGKTVDVLFTLPVAFKLDTKPEAQKEEIAKSKSATINISGTASKKDCEDPVILIDGKRFDMYVNDVSPDNIELVNVFKNKVPDKYLQYKNDCGIVEIILKNPMVTKSFDIDKSNDRTEAEVEVTSPKENELEVIIPEFILKPNPANDILSIAIDDNSTIGTVYVIDMLGQKVKDVTINNKRGELNVSDLANGSYLLSTKTQNRQLLKKFVVNR